MTVPKLHDKVCFKSAEMHTNQPSYYPVVGTIGRVIAVPTHKFPAYADHFIQWPFGSTSGDDRWYVNCEFLEVVEETPDA